MKIESPNPEEIPRQITVLNIKSVQVKKGLSMKDLIELKNKKLHLQKAVLIGEKLYVENKWGTFYSPSNQCLALILSYFFLFFPNTASIRLFLPFTNQGSGSLLDDQSEQSNNFQIGLTQQYQASKWPIDKTELQIRQRNDIKTKFLIECKTPKLG